MGEGQSTAILEKRPAVDGANTKPSRAISVRQDPRTQEFIAKQEGVKDKALSAQQAIEAEIQAKGEQEARIEKETQETQAMLQKNAQKTIREKRSTVGIGSRDIKIIAGPGEAARDATGKLIPTPKPGEGKPTQLSASPESTPKAA